MSWDTLATSGKGTLLLWLRIAGIPTVFGDSTHLPNAGDAWFWGEGHTVVKPWLRVSMAHDERGSFVDGTMEMGGVPVELIDNGEMTALVASWISRRMTRLVATLAAGAVASATTEAGGSTDFPAGPSDIYVGQETIGYTNKADSSHFNTLTRGKYGSHDVDHVVDLTTPTGPVFPSILDGPEMLDGRRADFYAATLDPDGTVSAGRCIYRGYVASVGSPGECVWPLKIDHQWKTMSRKVAADLPSAVLARGYWFSGEASSSRITITELKMSASPPTGIEVHVAVPVGWYAGAEELARALGVAARDAQAAAGVSRPLILIPYSDEDAAASANPPAGAGDYAIGCGPTGDADYAISLDVHEGDPLWCLGFEPATYTVPINSGNEILRADVAPRLFFCEIPGIESSAAPVVGVEDSSDLVSGQYVRLGQGPAVLIQSVTGNLVTLDPDSWDPDVVYSGSARLRWCVVEDEPADLVMQHVFALIGASGEALTLREALERICNLAGTHPDSWGLPGWQAADFFMADLDAALTGLPTPLRMMRAYLTDPITAAGLLCDRLGLVGITPRIVADGAIGFVRLETPASVNAMALEVDEAICEAYDAARVRTQMASEPRINAVVVQHSYRYVDKSWPEKPSQLLFDDGRAALGATRSRTYVCYGLHVQTVTRPCYDSEDTLLNDVKTRAIGAHFGIYGRIAPVVRVPCVWLARQFYVGDIVYLTHPAAVDVPEGRRGMDRRLGVIVGRHHAVTRQEADYLDILIPPDLNVAGIAPAAKGTSWDAGTLELKMGDGVTLYAQTGHTDLEYFAAGQKVRLYTFGSSTPSLWTAEIATVAADHVHLSSDPFLGLFPAAGVVMTPGAWADADAVDQARWIRFADPATYKLGGTAPGKRWAL